MGEEVSGSPEATRRGNFLKWNRGARIYAREVTKLAVHANYPKMKDFAGELVALACSRMLLRSPDESSDVDELEQETNLIQNTVDELENNEYQTCIVEIESLNTLSACYGVKVVRNKGRRERERETASDSSFNTA